MLNLSVTNIFAEGRDISIFHRVGNELMIMKEKMFFPYFYERDTHGVFRGYGNVKLKKITCRNPYQVKQKRTSESYESDILYTKRYLLDKVNITKAKIRWIMFDTEMITDEMPDPQIADKPISCITAYDNYTEEYKSFFLDEYETEYKMLDAFIKYIKSKQPDLLIAYNAYGYDYPYLINRFPSFPKAVSPINKVVKRNSYPAGISIVDYMEIVKKVYKYKKYSLENVYCEEFNLTPNFKKPDFSKLTDEIKERNKHDVYKMVELEKKLKLIDYFDELRRTSKSFWEDICQNSRIVDGVILQVAKKKGIILPKRPDYIENLEISSKDKIKGAYVYAESGLHEQVHLFDIGGTYPNLIVTFNLDPANKREKEESNCTKIRNILIAQNPTAIVPTVAQQMMNKRSEIQTLMKEKKGEEYDLLKKKDEAIKSLVNSLYGILLYRNSRLFDKDIASIITFLARFLIRYTKKRLSTLGYHVIMSDTDSVFVKTADDYKKIEYLINNTIIPEWLHHFGKEKSTLKFKYEGTFSKLFILTKKHYLGFMTKVDGTKKRVVKGLEIVRADTSKFTEKFQEELFVKIMNKETKDNVIEWIKSEIERMKSLSLTDIAFPCKLQRQPVKYKNVPIFVRAIFNTQELITNYKKRTGEYYYYIYTISNRTRKVIKTRKIKGERITKEIDEEMNVFAFDENEKEHIKDIDWIKMVDRNVLMKCKGIFEAMGWDISEITKENKVKCLHCKNKICPNHKGND